MSASDPLGNLERIVDIRDELQRRRAERFRKRIVYAVTLAGHLIAVASICYFAWRGIWETFT